MIEWREDGRNLRFPEITMADNYCNWRRNLATWAWKETRVLDVGACVGGFGLALLDAQPSVQIEALEPWPACWEWWEHNLGGVANARLHKVAATKEAGPLWIHDGGRIGLSGTQGTGAGVNALGVCLDDFGKVSLIKVDVEGHEIEALQGARNIIERYRPRLLVEILEQQQEQAGRTATALVKFILSLGYRRYGQAQGNDTLFSF